MPRCFHRKWSGPAMILGALALALPAVAQEAANEVPGEGTAVVAAVDIEEARGRGEVIATGGGAGGISAACITCHGTSGLGDPVAGFPRLAGLGAYYMAKQLDDYADGNRPNDIMTPIAEALSARDREDVALYYAGLDPEQDEWERSEIDPALLQRGGVLYAIGSAEDNIPACDNCHGPRGEGLPPIYPGLAGQHASYAAMQLQLFKDGIRRNDTGEVMRIIAGNMSEADIEAVATYLAELKP